METKALKAKRPGFSDDRYNETQYYVENGKKTPFSIIIAYFKRPGTLITESTERQILH